MSNQPGLNPTQQEFVSPGFSTGSATGLPPTSTPSQVSDASLYFLQDELIKYIFEVRTGVASLMAASNAKTLTEAKAAGDESMEATRDFGMALLEEHGFNIGLRLTER